MLLIPPSGVFGLIETNHIYDAALRSLRLVRLFRLIILFSRGARIVESTNNRILYTILLSSMAVTMGALTLYFEESNVEGTKVATIGDAFWWAIVTVITVGYGDVYPITIEGRVTSALLMITGIAVLGVLISTLGAGLVESRLKKITIEDSRIIAIKERIDNLEEMDEEEIKSLNVSINSLHRDLIKGDSHIYNLFSAKCDHANLGGALYCNMCGHSLKAKNISSRQEIK